MIEKTLVLVKPDGVHRGLIGEIISRFEKPGFKIIAMKMAYADKDLAGKHYEADDEWLEAVGEKQKKFYGKKGIKMTETNKEVGHRIRSFLMDFLQMSPIVALILEGHNAVEHIRKICGATAPSDAVPGTIRGDFALDTYQLADNLKRPIQNLIHASGSVKEAEREIKIWFKPEDIHAWKKLDEIMHYRKGGERI